MNYAFDVERMPLKNPANGRDIDRDAIVRTDTEEVLGIVSKEYNLVKHADAVKAAETVLAKSGHFFKADEKMTHNGSRLYMTYRFPDVSIEVGRTSDGRPDTVNPQLIVTNSYDGLLKFGFILGAFRFVCSNGLVIGHDIFEIHKKHTSGLDIEAVEEKAGRANHFFFNDVIPKYKELTHREVNVEEKMKDIQKKGFPKRLSEKIAEKIVTKAITSEWNLYNEYTTFLTHDYNKDGKKSYGREMELQRVVARSFGI